MLELLMIASAIVAILFMIKYLVNNAFPILVGLVIATGLVYAYDNIPEVGIYANLVSNGVQSSVR